MKYFLRFAMMPAFLLFAHCGFGSEGAGVGSEVLVNHLGYNSGGAKTVVFQTTGGFEPRNFSIHNLNDKEVFSGNFESGGAIDSWHTGRAYRGSFSDFDLPGKYYAAVQMNGSMVKSKVFEINDQVLAISTLDLLTKGIRSQRAAGEFNEADKNISFFGERDDIIDASGGWYDASGDRGKYLSHLSYANFMNPQQAPMVVWNFLETLKNVEKYYKGDDKEVLKSNLIVEAVHGADWLIRMQDEEGYFYINVFANWSWDPAQREICAYIGQEGFKNDNYEAGYREGGGMSIAALARAAAEGHSGEFSTETYLEAAIRGFHHLEKYNHLHIADGKENIIDDYCALMAATELYHATGDRQFLEAARVRMQNLTSRLTSDETMTDFWRADDENIRSFFHAAEAGLPVVSLVRYLNFETDSQYQSIAVDGVRRGVAFELAVTSEVNNPFGYARQYVKAVNEDSKRTSFFIPQNNETGYWWQGENARLASLATAMYQAFPYLDSDIQKKALHYASDQKNWILGLNPFNMTMLHGRGYNNPSYAPAYSDYRELNVKGCVLNGITAGFGNESDIAFRPAPWGDDVSHMWRWSEQWLQHGSWLMVAIGSSLGIE
ncbi:glycoside hydrolase family 9 protein [Alkalitalea saponilacus]|uniref:N-terminal ig-like domain of cellulase n=1 Tax=Alkalitalea saponilacus TaxID=889453 RepID=A0A1T5HS34_9BACT|nr:glycoside hydrolase family 9 protein [Alkalitalea saponilacus]ASB50062.1 hypothetical protein CDL62_13400 [Alkalitalea saponilacus]SKC23422.1 N-terminal ig-like domain of cellulase [Alkalitalea saponilacus]